MRFVKSQYLFFAVKLSSDILSCRDVFSEKHLEYGSYKRLNKEQLREEREREVKAYKLEPVCEQRDYIKAQIIRIIQKCRNKAHCRAHQADCRADDCCFKQYGVSCFRVKYLARKLK
jgi:hypothetical protein